ACGAGDSGIPPDWAATANRPGVHRVMDFSDRTVDDFARLVAATKRARDVAIASIHWGGNWGFEIPPEHRRFAHALIDRAGIDLVHGHSSHHPKAIEIYRQRAILYGCGDFIDDYEGIKGYEEFRDDLVVMYISRCSTPAS
ncbi:MAG: CapA family protein, partial [Gemmatimonadota bacterium]